MGRTILPYSISNPVHIRTTNHISSCFQSAWWPRQPRSTWRSWSRWRGSWSSAILSRPDLFARPQELGSVFSWSCSSQSSTTCPGSSSTPITPRRSLKRWIYCLSKWFQLGSKQNLRQDETVRGVAPSYLRIKISKIDAKISIMLLVCT